MQAIGKWVFAGAVAVGAAAGPFLVTRAEAQVVPPRPLEHAQPELPRNRFGRSMEGWVVLRYTVLADGRTADVRVLDRMPPQLIDRNAVAAVKAWTFEPATAGGKPIEWHNNESVVVFDDDTVPLEPSPLFSQTYLEVADLIKQEDYDKALKRNEAMLSTLTSRLAEVGLAEMQRTVIAIGLGDLHGAYAAVLRATDPRVLVLGPDDLKVALQYRDVLELDLGDLVGALETLARRNEIEPVPDSDAMAARAATLEQAVHGESPIAIKAKVADEYWLHRPTRRTFAIADVEGELKAIQVDCDRRSAELAYMPDSEWTLPESWGACSLLVEGRRETEFVFYEFP